MKLAKTIKMDFKQKLFYMLYFIKCLCSLLSNSIALGPHESCDVSTKTTGRRVETDRNDW